jgi:hypothetical protein
MTPQTAQAVRQRSVRDGRIDLARGLTMLFIFIAHVPDNLWADFIPARMGYSSGAEAFVLCSGIACGLAFGGTYRRDGFAAGTRRILRRIRELWLMQIASFVAFVLLMLSIDGRLGGTTYRDRYDLGFPAGQPLEAMLGLITLRYTPGYFDILPLYIVLLAMTPLMVALAGRSRAAVLAVSAGLWLFAQARLIELPALPSGERSWYFDPLAWQFLFFLGFGASSGWFKPPAATPARLAAAAFVVLGSFVVTFWGFHALFPVLDEIYQASYPADAITHLHPLRLIHALALGWLFAVLLAPSRTALDQTWLTPLHRVGQQALSTFVAGVFLSALAGVALDTLGRNAAPTALVNVAGVSLLVAVAYMARALKAQPAKPVHA